MYQDKQAVFYNAYTTIGKNLTQIYNSEVRREYINQCVETIRTKNYIVMALLDSDNFLPDIRYYKTNQLKYIKKKDNTTQTESNILFEELYNKIISKIETEYILQRIWQEQAPNEEEQEPNEEEQAPNEEEQAPNEEEQEPNPE